MNMLLKDKIEERKLWEEYQITRNLKIRETFVKQYIYLVKYIADKMKIAFPSYIEIDDLISYGYFGLLDAIEKFDITQNIKFKTYAIWRIRGAILDGIREEDIIPRSRRERQKKIKHIECNLRDVLNREPTDYEIANRLQMSITVVMECRIDDKIVSFNPNIICETVSNDKYRPDYIVANKDISERILKLLNSLPEIEKKVLILYYYDELTLKEIGEIYGVTESRACQLHTKAIRKLKEYMIDKKDWL